MSARVYFMKRVKDVLRRVYKYNRMQSKHKQTKCEHGIQNS